MSLQIRAAPSPRTHPNPCIRLHALGSLDLRADGRRLDSLLAQAKRFAFLVYLTLQGRSCAIRRDRLLAIFWPELTDRRGRHALHQALHFLRRHLGPHVIVANGADELRVCPDGLWCDAVAFSEAIEAGEPERALDLYRGDLLEGLFVSGAPEFEEWRETRRASLRNHAAEAAWHLAEGEEARGRIAQAVVWGRRAVELAPSLEDERAVHRMVELLHRVGISGDAVRTYDAFTARLARELDLVPSAGLQRLVAGIRRSASASGAMTARGLCRRGRHFLARRTADGVARAGEAFLAATRAAPRDSCGYVGLAEVYALLPWYAGADAASARGHAEAAAAKALELDPDLAGPRAVQAAVSFWFAGNGRWSDDGFRRALDVDPGHATTQHWYALILVEQGRFEAAVQAAATAWTLDPASPMIGTDYAKVLRWARRDDQALQQIEATLELEPGFHLAHERRWQFLTALGRYDEATGAMLGALRSAGWGERETDALQEAWAKQGWEGVLRRRLAQVASMTSNEGAAALEAALLCGLLGRAREALDGLERARAHGSPALGLAMADSAFDAVRTDRRFRSLARSAPPGN